MQFLARTNTYAINFAIRSHRLGHVQQLHAWNFRHEDFAAVHLLEATNHKSRALFESDPETRHAGIGNCDPPTLALLHKYGNDAPPAADYIAIPCAAEVRILSAGVGVCLHKHLLGAELGRSVKIDGINGFIGAEGHDPTDTAIDRSIDHIFPAHDVGLNCFKRIVFTGRH